jgi:CubicO group peptidase (beta-lactamase class C family)
MLSAMIEGATKMDFPDFMKTSVFSPLNIDIDVEKFSGKIENLSKFYEVENNEYKEVYKVNNSNKWAGGGFIATPTDLVILGNAFLNHKLLNEETVQSLTQPVTLTNGQINEQSYAIGWRSHASESVFKDNYPVQIFHHAGMATGSTSIFVLFPEYNTSISLLINKTESPSNLFKYAYDLIHLFIHKP